MFKLPDVCSLAMNHYVFLSLTSRKSSIHLHDLNSPSTALKTFTPRRYQFMKFGQYKISISCLFRNPKVYYCPHKSSPTATVKLENNSCLYVFHVKLVPCHYVMARSRVADRGDGLQIWRIAANILNKQLRTADRVWP
jgi:hypothetical protein